MKHNKFYTWLSLGILCCIPLVSFADPLSIGGGSGLAFFAPPETDLSLKVIASIFGSGTDPSNGKLIRPLLTVLCSGIVIFMGVIFAWNITKFVLHSSQHGEMMVGRGKEMGLVVLRSVFGMSMVMPIYAGPFKSLCMSFVVVGWLITQGVGLADKGIGSIVGYLKTGGTIHEVSRQMTDTSDKQSLVSPMASVLAAEACVFRLKQLYKNNYNQALELHTQQKTLNLTDQEAPRSAEGYIGIFMDNAGAINFGTKSAGSSPTYFAECGKIQTDWSSVTNTMNPAGQSPAAKLSIAKAALGNVVWSPYTESMAKNLAYNPNNIASFSRFIPAILVTAVTQYAAGADPLRALPTGSASAAANAKLDKMYRDGWITLGAYYPMMGSLNSGVTRIPLSQFKVTFTPGTLASGNLVTPNPDSAVDLAGTLKQQDVNGIKAIFDTASGQISAANGLIVAIDTRTGNQTLAEYVNNSNAGQPMASGGIPDWMNASTNPGEAANATLFQGMNYTSGAMGYVANATLEGVTTGGDSWAGGNFQENGAGISMSTGNVTHTGIDIANGSIDGANYVGINTNGERAISPSDYSGPQFSYSNTIMAAKNTTTNFFGESVAGFDPLTGGGESFRGLISQDKAQAAKEMFDLAAIPAGPIAWGSIPFLTDAFVRILDKFRNAIDQTQNPDPLLAIQRFGFDVLDISWKMIILIFVTTFVASFFLSFIPSSNPVGATGVASSMDSIVITMAFSAMLMLGIICGIYLPMIPFIVWISAILGWIGHTFQAIIGAPLVALRMTTAEGEGVLGGAVEGVMMLLGVLLTPFLLVMGMTGSLILIKQLLIIINSLFATFAFESFGAYQSETAWVLIGVPALLFIYFTLLGTVIQGVCTKLIAEMPSEVLRHLHSAMVGHKAAESMLQKMEHGSEKMGGSAGDAGGKLASTQKGGGGGGGGKAAKSKGKKS